MSFYFTDSAGRVHRKRCQLRHNEYWQKRFDLSTFGETWGPEIAAGASRLLFCYPANGTVESFLKEAQARRHRKGSQLGRLAFHAPLQVCCEPRCWLALLCGWLCNTGVGAFAWSTSRWWHCYNQGKCKWEKDRGSGKLVRKQDSTMVQRFKS